MMQTAVTGPKALLRTTKQKANAFLSFQGWAWLAIVAVAIMMTAVGANAQMSGKGGITGTVTDKTGAVVPNAVVTATSDSTKLSVEAKSTGAGDYNFSNLDPGIYSVTVAAQGFQKLTQQNIHVNALELSTFNPMLTVGASS